MTDNPPLLSRWPKADRDAWIAACRPGGRLSPGGPVSRMKPVSRDMHTRHYGYFINFCRRKMLAEQAEVAAWVTPENIEAFLAELERVGSVTRANYITKLRRVTELIAPERNFSWLRAVEAALKAEMRPRHKAPRIVTSDRLLRVGLDLMERADRLVQPRKWERHQTYRDGLMIALLALCPIRLKNFASLRVGHDICRLDETWWILIPAGETKTGRADERPIATVLTSLLDRWVHVHRSECAAGENWLWPSNRGGRLAYTYIGTRMTRIVHRELGVKVNPHLFRDAAVLTVALNAGSEMGVASGLLQHVDPRVTEKHYNKGASIDAVRKYQRLLGL